MRAFKTIAATLALAGVAVAGTATTTITADAHAAAPIRECGKITRYGIRNITSRGVPCWKARLVARDYVHGDYPAGRLRVRNFRHRGHYDQDIRSTWFGLVVRFQLQSGC